MASSTSQRCWPANHSASRISYTPGFGCATVSMLAHGGLLFQNPALYAHGSIHECGGGHRRWVRACTAIVGAKDSAADATSAVGNPFADVRAKRDNCSPCCHHGSSCFYTCKRLRQWLTVPSAAGTGRCGRVACELAHGSSRSSP